MITAEFPAVIKAGGLAEAVYGMANGLIQKGHQVTVIMPYYNTVSEKSDLNVKVTPMQVTHYFEGMKTDRIFTGHFKGINLLFIQDSPKIGDWTNHFALTDHKLYAIPNDENDKKLKERFAYFGSAASELIYQLKEQMDLVLIHDWHGAVAVPLLARRHTTEWLNGQISPLVYIIHNNGYSSQGNLDRWNNQGLLNALGLPFEGINQTAACLKMADKVCTVSLQYAVEVLGREANGLQHEIQRAAQLGKLTGITNGSNLATCNPQTEPCLINWIDPFTGAPTPLNFSAEDNPQEKKELCKSQLQKWLITYHPELVARFGIDVRKENVILTLTRFDVSQKGIDKLHLLIKVAYEKGAAVIIMGTGGDDSRTSEILDDLERMAEKMKDPTKWGGALILRDKMNKLGKLNFQQGSEDGIPGIGAVVRAVPNYMFIPSIYEPCGSTQLEGNRYASLSIGSAVGGLVDTVSNDEEDLTTFNGFLFDRHPQWGSSEQDRSITQTLNHACDFWNGLDKEQKNAFMKKVMIDSEKTGWNQSQVGLSPIEKYELVALAALEAKEQRGVQNRLNPLLLNLG